MTGQIWPRAWPSPGHVSQLSGSCSTAASAALPLVRGEGNSKCRVMNESSTNSDCYTEKKTVLPSVFVLFPVKSRSVSDYT